MPYVFIENQLLTLLVLLYRAQLEVLEQEILEFVSRVRDQLTIEEMDHVRNQISMVHNDLLWKRVKKTEKLLERKGIKICNRDYEELRTNKYHEMEICQSHGLRQGNFNEKVETSAPGDTVDIVGRTGCIEDGRLTGTFVSENVVNLSNRILSKAEVGLLSKGLNFSPTPSDLDRSKLKEDIESFKRRMRLKWFFRDND